MRINSAGNNPLIATVMAAELRGLGVSPRAIFEETRSFTTQEHFAHCSAIARERGWKATEIGILAPFWQFGRIAAMIKIMMMQPGQYEPIDLFVLGVTPFISVERVLA